MCKGPGVDVRDGRSAVERREGGKGEQCVQRLWGGPEGWKKLLWGGGKAKGETECAKALRLT